MPKPPKSESKILDTMAQAIAELGIDPWKAKLAKKLNCKAFKTGSRVDPTELKQFIADHPEHFDKPPRLTKEEADIKLKEVKIERETFGLEKDKGQHLKRSEVFQDCKTIGQHQRVVLQRKLETELPPKLVGKTAIEIGEEMRRTVDEICRIFHDRTQQWQ